MKSGLAQRHWSVSSLQVLRDALAARGLALAPHLAAAGLAPGLLDDPHAQVEASAELAVIERALAALGDPPGFGLEVGVRYRLAAYGVWGFAMLASSTVRDALTLGLEYQDLTYSVMPITLAALDGGEAVVFDDAGLPPALRRFMIERDLSASRQIMTDLWGTPSPCRAVTLSLPWPADTAPYEAVFHGPVRFEATHNAVIYESGMLDRPLPQANPLVAALHVRACQERLRQVLRDDGIIEKVTGAILARPGHFPALEEVAAGLEMAPRTLRRRLAEAGLGYRDLVARLRQDLAIEMLTATGLKVEAVAERLGYAETASFTHAFRRWTGRPPSSYARRGR